MTVAIRAASPADVDTLVDLIHQLAAYERLSDVCHASAGALARDLFGPRPFAEALIAEDDGLPVGFALFFHSYSTFLAKPGLYLEDLFVVPAARGRGVGRTLLARLASIALARGSGRLEWSVLDWNTPAIGFYRRMGAVAMDDWRVFRLTGEALVRATGARD